MGCVHDRGFHDWVVTKNARTILVELVDVSYVQDPKILTQTTTIATVQYLQYCIANRIPHTYSKDNSIITTNTKTNSDDGIDKTQHLYFQYEQRSVIASLEIRFQQLRPRPRRRTGITLLVQRVSSKFVSDPNNITHHYYHYYYYYYAFGGLFQSSLFQVQLQALAIVLTITIVDCSTCSTS